MAIPPPLPQVKDRISAGVDAGIITADQATALRQLPVDSAPQQFAVARTGDEPFALFRGFRDVFLSLGIIILAVGLGGVASEILGLRFDGALGWDDVALAAALAAIAWGVAEWVTGRLRMPLASLVTGSAFCLAFAATCVLAAGAAGLIDIDAETTQFYAIFLFGLSAVLFYLRFRLPFAMALIAGAFALLVYRVLEVGGSGGLEQSFQLFALVVGILIFIVAISYELRDPTRTRRHSENAFWLHLIAAPLIVFALTGGLDAMDIASGSDAIRVILVVAVLGLIALMIDRRAFIVSAMLYLGGAIGYAISQSGMPSNAQFAASALVLGLFVVGLALGWQPLRGMFLKLLPSGLSMRLPNPAGPDAMGG